MGSSTSSEWNTTASPDPLSEFGYSHWQSRALEVRRNWLRLMGMEDDEVEAVIAANPFADMDEELAQYNAMEQILRMNEESASR